MYLIISFSLCSILFRGLHSNYSNNNNNNNSRTRKWYICDLYSITCYALTDKLWLLETFVITLFMKVVSEIQVILWLVWKIHSSPPAVPFMYEACVGFMRHTNTML